MANLKAEVMSIGDELVSGQRLDTNSAWISKSLGEIGIQVRFHSTVGDDLDDHVSALKIAIQRADVVVMTGGLGPTADDLSRQAIANAANVDLEFDESIMRNIEKIFQRHGRSMPASNRTQAYFPAGSRIVPNPEGTAPGIDLSIDRGGRTACRVFALPGVPVEMEQMWAATIMAELKKLCQHELTIQHHTLHCFGMGESTIESMLPDLVKRGRDPQVGITASAATISLRISTKGTSKQECLEKMQPTIAIIRQSLGDLIFGENGQSLEDVVQVLLSSKNLTVSISDAGLNGGVANLLIKHNSSGKGIVGQQISNSVGSTSVEAKQIRKKHESEIGIAIGPLNEDEQAIAGGKSYFEVAISGPYGDAEEQFRFGGHSGWRKERATKQVLNMLRLYLTSGKPISG